jgi:hypothetical protein
VETIATKHHAPCPAADRRAAAARCKRGKEEDGALIVPATAVTGAIAATVPHTVDECVRTRVEQVSSRLDGVPGSGSAVRDRNGLGQVSGEAIAGSARSQAGDPVRLCPIALSTRCPPGDERGKVHRATNLHTRASWRATDAEHMYSGA